MKLPYYLKVTDKVEIADSKMFRVRINPKHKDNAGVIAHEEEHIKQWYIACLAWALMCAAVYVFTPYQECMAFVAPVGLILKDALYTVSGKVRALLEARAFRAELDVVGWEHLDTLAMDMVKHYDLGITLDEAKKLISR